MNHRIATKSRITLLIRTIQRLRAQYEGLPSHGNYEKLSHITERLRMEKDALVQETIDLKALNVSLTERLEREEEENRGKDEMIKIIGEESKVPVEKISDWVSKLTKLRLENRQMERKLNEMERDKMSLEKRLDSGFKEVASLEESYAKIQV